VSQDSAQRQWRTRRGGTLLPSRLSQIVVSTVLPLACLCASAHAESTPEGRTYSPYQEAQPVLQALRPLVPSELGADPNAWAQAWPAWTAQSDQAIRARLAQGDEDSLVHLLLFGTTFTEQPRVTHKQIEAMNAQAAGNPAAASAGINSIIRARLDDFVAALAHPGTNERLLFARDMLVTRKGYRLESTEGRNQVRQDLAAMITRVLRLAQNYEQIAQRAQLLGGSKDELEAVERAKLFAARGLSSDTSLRPNFAIEEALKTLRDQGIIKHVRRVAIIGPGLDFIDKQEGYDFYPQQTIQPFAIVDTLLRLGLANANDLQVTTLDLSTKVNAHIARAKADAQRGASYAIQLPLAMDEVWKPGFWSYWEAFGNQIGTPVPPVPLPAKVASLKMRAVSVRPQIGAMLTPTDVNIVLQRLELPAAEKFDLMIGTNIFVYYNAFEQGLALQNMAYMLKPGGVLLSNTALSEVPAARMKLLGSTTVVYSDRRDDGDVLRWYQRQQG